jgi:hypothetical protein
VADAQVDAWKGEVMNRACNRLAAVILSLCLGQTVTSGVRADDEKPTTAEQERLQRFWRDYHDALKQYYGALDRIDWVAYYKNHGYRVGCNGCNGCNCGQPINFAPVFATPKMQWSVPATIPSGPSSPK